MSQCPMHTLLDFERFSHGTPRQLVNHLREEHRIKQLKRVDKEALVAGGGPRG